jgi:hypothetical protein
VTRLTGRPYRVVGDGFLVSQPSLSGMATTEFASGVNTRDVAAGVVPALVVVGVLGALLLTRPTVGFLALVGAGLVSSGVAYLVVQERETVNSMQRNLGQDRHYTGHTGGVLGAWVGDAAGEKNARRYRIAVAVVSFSLTLMVGSFATLLFAPTVSTWLGFGP